LGVAPINNNKFLAPRTIPEYIPKPENILELRNKVSNIIDRSDHNIFTNHKYDFLALGQV
jgi:hypothetical protein